MLTPKKLIQDVLKELTEDDLDERIREAWEKDSLDLGLKEAVAQIKQYLSA